MDEIRSTGKERWLYRQTLLRVSLVGVERAHSADNGVDGYGCVDRAGYQVGIDGQVREDSRVRELNRWTDGPERDTGLLDVLEEARGAEGQIVRILHVQECDVIRLTPADR